MEDGQCSGAIELLYELVDCEAQVMRSGDDIVMTFVVPEKLFSRYVKLAFRPVALRRRRLH